MDFVIRAKSSNFAAYYGREARKGIRSGRFIERL